jgi:predicted nucleotidyltransferase
MNLEKILFFTNHQKILRFLLDNPGEKFYDRQISLLSSVSRAGTNFALRDLAKMGIIEKEKKGKLNFYYIALNFALAKELKIVLNIMLLNELTEKTKEYCSKIVLFGSAAKGENTKESDIDILFLTTEKQRVNSIVLKDKSREKIQPIIATQNDFIKMKTENPVFYKEVSDGKVLWIKE